MYIAEAQSTISSDGIACNEPDVRRGGGCFDACGIHAGVAIGDQTHWFSVIPINVQRASALDHDKALKRRFYILTASWKSARGHSSKTTDLVMHQAYQEIIGMGADAIPLLLEEMKLRPDHWDWALRAITGVDPVPKTAWGKLQEIKAAWVAWGRSEGYIG